MRIAYWTMGEGPPLVQMPNGTFSNIDFEWRWPDARYYYERLAQGKTLIRYDGRGTGLSDRDVQTVTLDTMVADLSAVVQSAGLDAFALMGLVDSGPPAIAYAVDHPERISHLILWCAYANGAKQEAAPEMPALIALADKDWDLFIQALSHATVGWGAGDAAKIGAKYIQECIKPEVLRVAWAAAGKFDVSDLLPRVAPPTLVLFKPAVRWLTAEITRDLVAVIPNARLATLDGVSALPWTEDADAVVRAINDFLEIGRKSGTAGPLSPKTDLPVDSDSKGHEPQLEYVPPPYDGTQPPIQYTTTADGVRIGYSCYGTGPLTILVDLPNTNIEFEWRVPEVSAVRKAMASYLTLDRYDPRGFGVSQRDVRDFSVDAMIRDLDAIVSRLAPKEYNIVASAEVVPVVAAFAAKSPPGLNRLILVEGSAKGSDNLGSRLVPFLEAAGDDWELASESFMHAVHGWAETAAARRGAAFLRESTTLETLLRFLKAVAGWDVTALLPRIDAPTLVLNSRTKRYAGEEAGRDLASRIPNAQLVILEGTQEERFRATMLASARFLLGGAIPPELQAGAGAASTIKDAAAVSTFAGGRYVVRRALGEGAQKSVFLVHDEELDRDCSLAIIKAEGLDEDALGRLRREGQAMARLGAHPNVVTVFDTGVEGGRPYLVCEYVAGGDLREKLRSTGGAMPVPAALRVAADIAQGLALAHAHEIIHRDLKPANVWLTESGTAKLGDFGVAVALDRSRLTLPGMMMGTAAYMPPEQALCGEVDARSDLYSLGAMLYEMVTGLPPFPGDDPLSVVAQHINAAPVAPSSRNPEVPPRLEALILRLLAKAPAGRPASAESVLEELRGLMQR